MGLRWQMHSGGHPHVKPAGLCSLAMRVRDTPAFYADYAASGTARAPASARDT